MNHVAGYEISTLEVVSIDAEIITARRFFDSKKTFTFHLNGVATWSPNLSICHEDLPNPHAEKSRSRDYGW